MTKFTKLEAPVIHYREPGETQAVVSEGPYARWRFEHARTMPLPGFADHCAACHHAYKIRRSSLCAHCESKGRN
jgi:hypothetical protein